MQDRLGVIRGYIDQAIGVRRRSPFSCFAPAASSTAAASAGNVCPRAADAEVSRHRHAWAMVPRQRALAHSPIRALPYDCGIPNTRGEMKGRNRAGHRSRQGPAPDGSQLPQGAGRRPQQCCPRRRRIQLPPSLEMARSPFARIFPGRIHVGPHLTENLNPRAERFFTGG